MLTAVVILDLLAEPFDDASFDATKLAQRERRNPADASQAQLDLLDFLSVMRVTTTLPTVVHPGRTVIAEPRPWGGLTSFEATMLADAERHEPQHVDRTVVAQISHLLAHLEVSVHTDPRLTAEVRRIYAPLDAYWQMREAENRVALAHQADWSALWPEFTAAALADALRHDNHALTAEQAHASATAQLDAHRARLADRQHTEISTARADLDRVRIHEGVTA